MVRFHLLPLVIGCNSMNKTCSHCHVEKNTSEFSPRKDRGPNSYQSWCKECNKGRYHSNPDYRERNKVNNRASRIRRRSHRRPRLDELKSVPCADCGGSFPSVCMDFHHLDESTKKFSIGNSVGNLTWDSILAEAAKCVVICANCHRIRHHSH